MKPKEISLNIRPLNTDSDLDDDHVGGAHDDHDVAAAHDGRDGGPVLFQLLQQNAGRDDRLLHSLCEQHS